MDCANCQQRLPAHYYQQQFSPYTFQVGLDRVLYQASDVKGNTSTCNFNVIVEGTCSNDTQSPVISNCPSNITVAAVNGFGVANWTAPTATDNCGLVSFSSTYLPGSSFPVGVTVVIYTAGDLSGNGATCEFNVAVVEGPGCTNNASPINLSTNLDAASVNLSWNDAINAASYDVYLGTSNPPTNVVASNISGTSTTVTGLLGGTTYYWYVVPKNAAGSATGCSSTTTQFSTAAGNTGGGCNTDALFVVGSTNLNSSDAAVKNRLVSLGFNVTVVSDNGSSTSDADGKGLILISSTVNSGDVNSKFRYVEVPVICYEPLLYDDMRMTNSSSSYYGTDSYEYKMTIKDASHPIAAGLSGHVQIFNSYETVSYGVPLSSAAVIANKYGSSSRSLVFAYEDGAGLNGISAPARRVGFFLQNTSATSLTADGLKIFDAAVKWAAGLQTPGTPCNDGNPNTENDVILADGCTCQGTSCDGALAGLSFYDLNTGAIAFPIVNGGTYQLSDLPTSYNILATTSGTLESVRFNVSGAISDTHTENVLPYHYRGDTNPLSLGVGNYTFLVSVYSQDNASGISCDQQTISFTISDTPPCDPIQLVCESNINNNGWVNHGDCTVVVCQGDQLYLSVNPNGAQFSSMTGPNGYNATSSGGNDFLISTSVNQSHAGNYYVDLIDGNGCPGSTVITVVVQAATPVAVCKNHTLQLTSIGQSVQFSGQDLDGGSTAGCNATITSLNASPTSYSQPEYLHGNFDRDQFFWPFFDLYFHGDCFSASM
ncbi:MAG: HYR domain-containing protein [Saprospiraceae bacterium]